MLSYNNDPAVKEMFIARFDAHVAADEVIQGTGFKDGKGCFIGCSMNDYSHKAFAEQIGPEWLAHLAEKLFENCKGRKEGAQFGMDLLRAIPVGVDLEPVRWKLAIWRHTNDLKRLEDNDEPYAEKCRAAIRQVIAYCEAELLGKVDGSTAWSARYAAWSAESAKSTAWSAWSAKSAESAESARYAAKSAKSAKSTAWSAHFAAEREMLLKLIREAK